MVLQPREQSMHSNSLLPFPATYPEPFPAYSSDKQLQYSLKGKVKFSNFRKTYSYVNTLLGPPGAQDRAKQGGTQKLKLH